MLTGLKKPGIAHDAATASAIGANRPSRPNTIRRPSDWRTAQIHNESCGHSVVNSPETADEMNSVLTEPSGISPASNVHGAALKGRAAARASEAAICAGRRGVVDGRSGARRNGPTERSRCAPSSDIERPWAWARPSAADSPARNEAAVIEPADVPVITCAVRGSQPDASSNAASTPAWNAPPATPPAPSTSPIRGGAGSDMASM